MIEFSTVTIGKKIFLPQVVIQEPPPVVYRVGWDVEVTHDGQVRQKSIDYRGDTYAGGNIGIPSVYQLHDNIWIQLTKERQLWLFDVLCLAQYGRKADFLKPSEKTAAIKEWRSFMKGDRCFTNGKGWNNGRRDYIQKLNAGAKPMEWEPLVLSGTKLWVTGAVQNFPKKYWGVQASYSHFPIRTVDPDDLPEPEDFLNDEYVCGIPTTIRPDGTRGIFPMFGGRSVYPVMALGGTAWIWTRLAVPL